MSAPLVDWRGTPITPGALVLYPAMSGRSPEIVEATVAPDMLTAAGRVRLVVNRRSRFLMWGAAPHRVSVDHTIGLTVIDTPCPDCHWDAYDACGQVRLAS